MTAPGLAPSPCAPLAPAADPTKVWLQRWQTAQFAIDKAANSEPAEGHGDSGECDTRVVSTKSADILRVHLQDFHYHRMRRYCDLRGAVRHPHAPRR